MNPTLLGARTNLELIIAEVEALCKEEKLGISDPSRIGRPSKYSDIQIIEMVIIQNLLGFDSELSFIRFLGNLSQPIFEKIPSQPTYNRRVKQLRSQIETLTKKLLNRLHIERSKTRIVDASGIPLIRLVRKKRRKLFRGRRYGIGYCASLKTYYFGLKITLFLNREGIPTNYYLMPANKHDNRCLEKMLIKNQFSNLVLVGDIGYLSNFNKRWFKECWNIQLITPYKVNQKKKNTKKEKQLLKKRKIVETVIGQLKDHLKLDHLRARTYETLDLRINNILFSYIFGVYFNKKYHRNPLNLKSIIT
ncbi:MAG: IS982 family transposase [Candidatus Aminicenantia bacterium]